MRHPAISLGLGLAAVLGFSLATGGCVSAKQLRSVYQGVADAQGPITDGITALDAACQSLARAPAELVQCRTARDQARKGLRDQLVTLGSLTK